MPASNIDLLHMQYARNNFDAMRPAPICPDSQLMGQCQSVHISTNCYYGYQYPKNSTIYKTNDCEMMEIAEITNEITLPKSNARKRSSDDDHYPQMKRVREEAQRKKTIEPETNENMRLKKDEQELLESLYWNIHGGHTFQIQPT